MKNGIPENYNHFDDNTIRVKLNHKASESWIVKDKNGSPTLVKFDKNKDKNKSFK